MSADWSEGEWRQWIERSPSLVKITPAALAQALEGFPVQARRGTEWLARAIQGALLFTFPALRGQSHPETGECCVITVPNATEQKKIYGDLHKAADDLLAAIYRNSDLLAYSLATPQRYAEIVKQLERMSGLFADAADRKPLPPRWRQKRVSEDLVQMATVLAPVFAMAFEKEPTVDNFDNWKERHAGSWPDFFQRIMLLVTSDCGGISYFRSICKKARRLDLLHRVTFAPGQLPE